MANDMPSQVGTVPNPDPTLRTVEQLLREIANARELIESKVNGNFTTLHSRIESVAEQQRVQAVSSDRNVDIAAKSIGDVLESRLSSVNQRIDNIIDTRTLMAEAGYKHIDTAISDLRDLISARIDGIDSATNLFRTQSSEQLSQLKQLHQEKFDSIAVQFAERDTRTEQTAAGVKIAVDAALQAAKEAVAEQNRSFALATGKSETATMKQIDALGLAIQTANKGLDDKIADMKDRLTRIEGMDLGASRSDDRRHETVVEHHGSNQNAITIGVGIIAALSLSVAVYAATRLASSPPPQYMTVEPALPHQHLQMRSSRQVFIHEKY